MQADGLVAPRNSHLGDAGPKESLTLGWPNTPALLSHSSRLSPQNLEG